MNKVKKISILCLTLTILIGCKKRDIFVNNSFADKTFNWEITIPDDYEKIDLKERGAVKGDTALVKNEHLIVAFKRDKANYFSANYEDFLGNDIQMVNLKMKMKDFLLLKNIGQIYPKGQMGDYTVTTENITGLPFRKSKIEITESGKTVVTLVNFSRVFNDKNFVACIVYEDEDYGKEMIDLFKKSTFKK